MPPQPLLDIKSLDFGNVIATHEDIYKVNPHAYEFALLDGICHLDQEKKEIAAWMDVRPDAFWVRGHIPGRPLLPGVLMIESAAQMISYYVNTVIQHNEFFGFAAVDEVKFRGQVVPGDRLVLLGKMAELRGTRRAVGLAQGFVGDRMVFEGTITGMMI